MKGHTNNLNGRPKGKPNKVTTDLREKVNLLIANNYERIQQDLDAIEPNERLRSLFALMEFVLPKLQRVSVEVPKENDGYVIDWGIDD